MTVRIVVSAADRARATSVAEVVAHAPGVEVLESVSPPDDLATAVVACTPDVVVIDAGADPDGALARSRELAVGHPGEVAVVLLADGTDPALAEAATAAGVDTVVPLPADPDALGAAIAGARPTAPPPPPADNGGERRSGRVVVLAGAKGGVGTTTLATQLALLLHDAETRRVALVDLDLQAGDVRHLLDVWHPRTVADLPTPTGEPRSTAARLPDADLAGALHPHRSGVSLLLAPRFGEEADAVDGSTIQAALTTMRGWFDLVLVDVGAVATKGGIAATGAADEVVVVLTPDIPALKGANRLLALWERLGVRHGDVRALVNRFSRRTEVGPELIRRVLDTDVLDTMLPADYAALDAATNSGVPDRIAAGPLLTGLEALAAELRLRDPADTAAARGRGLRRGRRR